MPENDYDAAPMILTKFTQGFGEVDYSIALQGAFEITTPLQAIEMEARAKGCAVMIQVALITLEELYGDQVDNLEGDIEDEREPGVSGPEEIS